MNFLSGIVNKLKSVYSSIVGKKPIIIETPEIISIPKTIYKPVKSIDPNRSIESTIPKSKIKEDANQQMKKLMQKPRQSIPVSTNLRELAQAALYRVNDDEPPDEERYYAIRRQMKKIPVIENRERTPLTLKLESLVNGAKQTHYFKNQYHMLQFLESAAHLDDYEAEADSLMYINSAGPGAFTNCRASVTVTAGGCMRQDKLKINSIETPYYIFNFAVINSREQNCALAAIRTCSGNTLGKSYNKIREEFGLKRNEMISPNNVYTIYEKYGGDQKLCIIPLNYAGVLNDDTVYFLLHKNHYYAITSYSFVQKNQQFLTKRGKIFFDVETRPIMTQVYYIDCCCKNTHDEKNVKCHARKSFTLGDTILNATVTPYKAKESYRLQFIRTPEKTPSRQFLDWLVAEADKRKFYKICAHNGSRFDFLFAIGQLSSYELATSKIQLRQHSVIGIEFKNNLFFDSYCFMTSSLEKLCDSFKCAIKKQTEVKFIKPNGDKVELSSKQLCFYKPELDIDKFLELQYTEPQFWEAYCEYCYYDCLSLDELWTKFEKLSNSLVESISPKLLKSASLGMSNTIGSHAKKIVQSYLEQTAKGKLAQLDQFFSITPQYRKILKKRNSLTEKEISYVKQIEEESNEKYEFVSKLKRGGISHCNKPGKYYVSVMSVDIASQYPAAMLYMNVPAGRSIWTSKYNANKYGFYCLKNLVFEKTANKFKPIADTTAMSLNWNADFTNKETYMDNSMIEYLKKYCGLKSFTVVKGLISTDCIQGEQLFGKFINTFYTEKRRQDGLKDPKSPTYNPLEYNAALRETIKLYLNSLSGKMVEDSSRYFSLEYAGFNKEGKTSIGEVSYDKTYKSSINTYLSCGIMLYSYSKQLLFEYMRCLPKGSDSATHVETDGIYFMTKYQDQFLDNLQKYEGDFPCKVGEELGNIKIEKISDDISYFEGKKFYSLGFKNGDDAQRVKGIPQETIDAAGNKVQLVNRQLYEDIYNNKEVTKSFYTMRKVLFGKTVISSHIMSRTIKGYMNYKTYFDLASPPGPTSIKIKT